MYTLGQFIEDILKDTPKAWGTIHIHGNNDLVSKSLLGAPWVNQILYYRGQLETFISNDDEIAKILDTQQHIGERARCDWDVWVEN